MNNTKLDKSVYCGVLWWFLLTKYSWVDKLKVDIWAGQVARMF